MTHKPRSFSRSALAAAEEYRRSREGVPVAEVPGEVRRRHEAIEQHVKKRKRNSKTYVSVQRGRSAVGGVPPDVASDILEALHDRALVSPINLERPLVAVLVPVLKRPHRVRPLVESFRAATSDKDATLHFVAQSSDSEEVAAIRAEGYEPILVSDDDRSWAKKINRGYASTREPWVLLAADDLSFQTGWMDTVRHLLMTHVGVVGTNDLGNEATKAGVHSTHPFVRRVYAQICGTVDEVDRVVHDGYHHNFPDTELVATAKRRGAYLHASDCHIEHLHPMWGKGSSDEIYVLGQSRFREDRNLFDERSKKFRLGMQAHGLSVWSAVGSHAPLLSILIPTVYGRERKLKRLLEHLLPQVEKNPVEVIFAKDARELIIGTKRNLLLQRASGEYIAFVDDDDMVSDDYVDQLLTAFETKPDVVCFQVKVSGIGKDKLCTYHPSFKHQNFPTGYTRKPNHIMAWRRELASRIPFPEITRGEDTMWAEKMARQATNIASLERVLYTYLFDATDNSKLGYRHGPR